MSASENPIQRGKMVFGGKTRVWPQAAEKKSSMKNCAIPVRRAIRHKKAEKGKSTWRASTALNLNSAGMKRGHIEERRPSKRKEGMIGRRGTKKVIDNFWTRVLLKKSVAGPTADRKPPC